jgi:hypothetical protein
MRKFLIIFATLILISGCESDIVEPIEQAEFGYGDDYSIYNKVLRDLSEDNSCLIVLKDSTQKDYISGSSIKYFTDNIPGLSVETMENYLSINQTKVKLKNIPGINHIFRSEYHDNSIQTVNVFISRVGYNSTKTQAVVTVGAVWAPLAGIGNLFYLEHNGKDWQIIKTVMTWIS